MLINIEFIKIVENLLVHVIKTWFTNMINNTGLQKNGVMIVVGQLGVISEVIFCVESESEVRIGPSCQDFEIFEVIYSKNGFLGYF